MPRKDRSLDAVELSERLRGHGDHDATSVALPERSVRLVADGSLVSKMGQLRMVRRDRLHETHVGIDNILDLSVLSLM